jgi:hypothetical protein
MSMYTCCLNLQVYCYDELIEQNTKDILHLREAVILSCDECKSPSVYIKGDLGGARGVREERRPIFSSRTST